MIIPWLNPHCRVLKTRNYSLEITLNQLRFLEGKVVKFLLIKDIGCFKLSDNSLEGKMQDIQSIVIRQKPPDSDGDILKQLCIQTIAGEIHSLSCYLLLDYQPIAQAIADYIGVEVTIEEVSS